MAITERGQLSRGGGRVRPWTIRHGQTVSKIGVKLYV